MAPHLLIADFALDWSTLGLALPIVAGLFAGLAVIGLVHYFGRSRGNPVAAPAKNNRPVSDPFIEGSDSEQRKSFRRRGNPIEVQIVDQATQGKPITAYVVNRSVGGLCLQVDQPLELLAELTVRPTNAPHIAPWVEVVVKNCRKTEKGYDVGCQFVKTPPWPVLMMFG